MADLLPASFRGIPFAVERNQTEAGRRIAVHEYPGKDGFNLEDLGRRGRRYRITGFVVSNSVIYGGGDVSIQRQAIIAAAELSGTGILIHPTLGILTVGCETCSVGDDLDGGTKAAVEFSFLEQTLQSILGISTNTVAAVTSAALVVDAAASTAFAAANISGISCSTASATWSAAVVSGGQDATALTNLAAQLNGPYGRYYAGGNSGYLTAGSGSVYSGDATVDDLVADAVTARAVIAGAASTVATDFASLTSVSSATAANDVQALVASLPAACADPADAIRLCSVLAASTVTGVTAVDDLYRRAAVNNAAAASSSYQPSSANDAVSIQAQITALIDNEIDIAGDEGDDGSYQAFRALRVAVVADLQARGGALAPLATFAFNTSLPALYLAQRLYSDGGRSDELIAEAAPINPLFLPTTFQALAA